MLNKLKNNFLTGLLVILPIILTITILYWLTKFVNQRILTPTIQLLDLEFNNLLWGYTDKVLTFILIILFISLIGLATRLLLLRNFFTFWERLLAKVPMVGKVYVTIKQISHAFLGQGMHVFDQVVLIEYPRKGIYSLGFITQQASKEIQQKTNAETVYIFLPTTPNPTNGFFLVVPKAEVQPLEMSVADAFKLIVSGGTFTPPLEKSG